MRVFQSLQHTRAMARIARSDWRFSTSTRASTTTRTIRFAFSRLARVSTTTRTPAHISGLALLSPLPVLGIIRAVAGCGCSLLLRHSCELDFALDSRRDGTYGQSKSEIVIGPRTFSSDYKCPSRMNCTRQYGLRYQRYWSHSQHGHACL